MVRLFPRRSGIRYCYPVHESLRPALAAKGIRLGLCKIPIHHFGYLGTLEELVMKAARYRKLGEKKIRQYPRYSLGYHELGRLCLHDGELPLAERLFTQCIRLHSMHPDAYYCLGLTLLRQGQVAKCKKVLNEALRRFRHHTNFERLIRIIDSRSKCENEHLMCFPRIAEKDSSLFYDCAGESLRSKVVSHVMNALDGPKIGVSGPARRLL
jgi:tetratricopeptide (TPR) repeat protein